MDTPAIRTEDLTKFYGAHRGVEGVDLTVRRGEVIGFLGPNGAGKTTLIRLLLDLLRPTRGAARVLGRDCRTESLAVRRQVGFLPGEYRLYENLSGRRNLSYLGGLGAAYDPGRAAALAERLDVDLDRRAGAYSHGTKQKLALVLAFLHAPPLLILDEPTSGLDPLVQQEFFALVREARDAGRTVFLSSHNLTEVERVCDRAATIRDGRIIAVEDIAALRREAVRLVELTCARAPDAAAFAGLAGVSDLAVDGVRLRCTVRGELGPLLAAAAAFGIVDVLSREPGLEEFFLAAYGEREGGHGD